MALKETHGVTGWAAGVMAAAVVELSGAAGPFHVWAIGALLMGYSGGGAPDWLEISWWRFGRGRHSWIPHRTLTHWGIAWLALLWLSYRALPFFPWMSLVFGFAAGGLMHLLADWPNPMGVPWLWVTWRHSLNWWKSGQYEWLVTIAAWAPALYLADKAWAGAAGWHHLLARLRPILLG